MIKLSYNYLSKYECLELLGGGSMDVHDQTDWIFEYNNMSYLLKSAKICLNNISNTQRNYYVCYALGYHYDYFFTFKHKHIDTSIYNFNFIWDMMCKREYFDQEYVLFLNDLRTFFIFNILKFKTRFYKYFINKKYKSKGNLFDIKNYHSIIDYIKESRKVYSNTKYSNKYKLIYYYSTFHYNILIIKNIIDNLPLDLCTDLSLFENPRYFSFFTKNCFNYHLKYINYAFDLYYLLKILNKLKI